MDPGGRREGARRGHGAAARARDALPPQGGGRVRGAPSWRRGGRAGPGHVAARDARRRDRPVLPAAGGLRGRRGEAEARRRRAGRARAAHRPAAAAGSRLMGDETHAARLELLLALADDELVLGHRHSEWTGWVPHLEEDLAFSSIAQDEMAHARLLYGLALPLWGEGWNEDRAALGREPPEYRNAVLGERPNRA